MNSGFLFFLNKHCLEKLLTRSKNLKSFLFQRFYKKQFCADLLQSQAYSQALRLLAAFHFLKYWLFQEVIKGSYFFKVSEKNILPLALLFFL